MIYGFQEGSGIYFILKKEGAGNDSLQGCSRVVVAGSFLRAAVLKGQPQIPLGTCLLAAGLGAMFW